MSSIDFATRLKGTPLRSGRVTHDLFSKTYIFLLLTYLVNQNFLCLNTFPRSTVIIYVLNELPTVNRHIKVPQYRLLCPTHVDNKKTIFSIVSFKVCYTTRPHWSPFKVVIHVEMPKAASKKSICHFQKLEMILKRNKQNTVRLPQKYRFVLIKHKINC